MATQIGPKIGIEGEKEYRQQIQQIIQQTKTLDSAMERTTSEWTKNTSALTKNKAVAQNLTQQIELQKEKINAMNGLLEASAEKFGENSTQTQRWQRTLNDANTSLNMMQQQLKQLGNAGNFSDLSTRIADVGTKMQNIGNSMVSVGQRLTTSLTLPIAAAGAAAVKLASDTEEARSKTEVTFGTMSESVKQFASDALNSYGLAEGSALQMVSTFGAMASSMGMSEQQSAAMSMSLTALAADMASFYNVSTEVAQTSLQGVFTGETEALKKFGIVMTQTNLEAFAEQQGKVYSKMSEAEKVMTRYAYVMSATKDAQGDFARTSDGTANSLRVFTESLKELGSQLGEAILPIVTPVVQALAKLMQKFAELPEPIRKVIVVVALIVAAIGPVIMIIGTLVSSLGTIVAAAPAVIAAITGIASAILGMEVAAGPAILVILGIAAAVAGAVAAGAALAYYWDDIAEAAGNMGGKIKDAFQQVIGWNDRLKEDFNSLVSDIISYFATLPDRIIQAIKQTAQKVQDEFNNMIRNAKNSGKDFIQGFVDGIKEKLNKVVEVVKNVAQTIQDYLGFSCPDKGPLHEYETWMPDFMKGLAKGIRSNMGLVSNAMDSVAKEMALPLSSNAAINMAIAGAGSDGSASYAGGTSMNIYVDHISELNDLIRIQNQAQQRYRMGAR